MNNFSLTEALQKIEELMAQGQWAEAHRACIEVLRFDPSLSNILRLKKKIEKKVKDINATAIKKDIKELKTLLKKHQYDELYQHIQQLKPYARDYAPLQNFIEKVEKKWQQYQNEEQKNRYNQLHSLAQQLMNDHKYDEALQKTKNLSDKEYNPQHIAMLVEEIKEQWIQYSIKESHGRFTAEQYNDHLSFLESLREIISDSKVLEQSIKTLKEQHRLAMLDQHRDRIFKNFEDIQTLIQLKKYDDAILVLEEILSLDAENAKAKKLLIKTKKQADKVRDLQLLEQIDKAHQTTSDEVKKESITL